VNARHILIELHGCPAERLNDAEGIQRAMLAAAVASGATVIATNFHRFSPLGVSGVVLIAESHLTIHTWPERGYAAVDVFTCGTSVDPWAAYASLKDELGASSGEAVEMSRGDKPMVSRRVSDT
jgi:S-adenosylmethionine decarboxylase proenzyme